MLGNSWNIPSGSQQGKFVLWYFTIRWYIGLVFVITLLSPPLVHHHSSAMYIDTNKTVHVLVPRTSHGASVWDAFTHCYKVKVTAVMCTDRGVVAFIPIAGPGNTGNLRKLSRLARAPIPTAANPLFIVPDARPEEMAAYGFDYRYNEEHPMHYIGKFERTTVTPPPAPEIEDEATTKKHAAQKIAFWFVRLSRRQKAQELDNMHKELSAMTRAKETQALRLKTACGQIKTVQKEKQRLKKTCKTTEKDRDQLLVTLQNVLSERDLARVERDGALEQASGSAKALELMNAVPVAMAVQTNVSDGQEYKEAYDALIKFSKYDSVDQLLSFVHKHNKKLKALLKTLIGDNKHLAKQCRRLEKENLAKVESLKKSLKAMKIQVGETRRYETYARICSKLMATTGAKNGKRLESLLEDLYEIAYEFKDFGGRPPLAGFILWAKTLSGLIGKGKSQRWNVPKLFALYNELDRFKEGHNTVDALHVFNVAMEQKRCGTLSEASVKLAKPSLVLEVGRYAAALAKVDLPEVWTEEAKKEAYHFCMHHTCDFTGDNSLLEIMLTLQDTQPLSISCAASSIYIVFQNVFNLVQSSDKSVKTHEDFLRCVFGKCQAGWQKRPYLMKCKSSSDAAIASRALCLRSCYQLGGVEIRNYPMTVPTLSRMARCWPDYDKKDYELLLEYEGDFLTEKHLFTLAALADPLKNAAFPWCTLQAYMQTQNTEMLWNIVLSSQSMYDAKRILTRIVGNRYITNDQITAFRQECYTLKAFKVCYNEDRNKPQKILLKRDTLIKVSGPRWEKSVATQMGCPYPDVTTTDDEYWNFIYQWIGKEKCNFQSDWHLSAGSSLTADDLSRDLALVKTPPVSPKLEAVTPAEHFIQTVDEGLRKATEEGHMSKRDMEELKATAKSLHAKIKIIDLQGALKRKDSLDEVLEVCSKQAGDAFFL